MRTRRALVLGCLTPVLVVVLGSALVLVVLQVLGPFEVLICLVPAAMLAIGVWGVWLIQRAS